MSRFLRSVFQLVVVFLASLIAADAWAQTETNSNAGWFSFRSVDTVVTQNFSGLGTSTGGAALLPRGWAIWENGGDANYAVSAGSANGGNSYNFGAVSNADRALGGLVSGSLTPRWGFKAVNNSGSTVRAVRVKYTAEVWRRSVANRNDGFTFYYRTSASTTPQTITNVTGGTSVSQLSYASQSSSTSTVNVSSPVATQTLDFVIDLGATGLPTGQSITFGWEDTDASGSDDGIGIDDVELHFLSYYVTAGANPVSPCAGASLSLTTTFDRGNNTGATFSWSGPGSFSAATQNATASAATGSYVVTVSKGTASMSWPVAVTATAAPATPTITPSGSTTLCSGQTVVLQGPAGATSYIWSNGATTQDITVGSTGSYTLQVTNAAGCTSAVSSAATVTVNSVDAPDPYPSTQSAEVSSGTGSVTFNFQSGVSGGGNGRIAVLRLATTTRVAPSANTSYNGSSDFATPAATNGTTGTGNVVFHRAAYTGVGAYIGGLASATNYVIDIYEYNQTGSCVAYAPVTSYNITTAAPTTPTITITDAADPIALSAPKDGSATTTSSYSVSGVALTDDIVVTATAPFSVSLDGTTFNSSVTITRSGTTASGNVWVRFQPTAVDLFTSTISHTTVGGNNPSVNVEGNSDPGITPSTTLLNFASARNVASSSQTASFSGVRLYESVSISAPTHFQVSTNSGTSWASTGTIGVNADGTPSTTSFLVRYNPSAAGSHSGNIQLLSSGLAQEIAVTGNSVPAISLPQPTGATAFSINEAGAVSTAISATVTGSRLYEDVVITASAGFEVSTTLNGTYGSSIALSPTSNALSATYYVRFTSSTTGATNGTITASHTDATSQQYAVTGTLTIVPIIITKFSQGCSGNGEWVELLVLQDNLDLRGYSYSESGGSLRTIGSTYSSGKITTFSTATAWSSVKAGTRILIYNTADLTNTGVLPYARTDFNAGVVILGHADAAYFTNAVAYSSGLYTNGTATDRPIIVNASNVVIDQLQTGSPTGGNMVVFTGSSYSGLATSGNWSYLTGCSSSVANGSPGQPVNGAQRSWICSLRGTGTPSNSGNTFSTSYASTTSVTYNITAPASGDSVLIIARLAANAASTPFDTGTYNVGIFGSGTGRALVGTNNYVVVKGTASSGTISGLTAGQEYAFDAYYFRNQGCIKIGSALTSTTSTCAPTPAITGGGSICAGASTTLSTTYVLQANEAYLWSNGATTQSISVSTGGDYTLQIRNTAASCNGPASNTASVTLMVYPVPSEYPNTQSPFISSGTNSVSFEFDNGVTGGGAGRIAVIRLASTAAVDPAYNTSYNSTTNFTSPAATNGTTGTGNVVFFSGTATGVTATVNNLTAATNYVVDIYEYDQHGSCIVYAPVTSYSITTQTPSTPTINVTLAPDTIKLSAPVMLTATTASTYNVAGFGLTGDIEISVPAPFKVSTDGGTFYSSVTLSRSGSTASGNIYVRFEPEFPIISNELISHSTPGGTTINVNVQGDALPRMTASPASLSFATARNVASSTSTGSVSSTLLYQPVEVTPPTHFQVSTNGGSSWSSTTVTLPFDGSGDVNESFLIRYNPSVAGSHSGNVQLSSSGLTRSIAVSGNSVPAITLAQPSGATSFTLSDMGTATTGIAATVSGIRLYEDVVITASAGFQVATALNGTYGSSITLTPTGNALSATYYVRFATSTTGTTNGTISAAHTDATTQQYAVSGTLTLVPIIITKFSQGCGTNGEWTEFLVQQDGLDLRGYSYSESASTLRVIGATYSSNKITTFANVSAWSSVKAGTRILIYNGADASNTGVSALARADAANGSYILAHNNNSYFTNAHAYGGGLFANGTTGDRPIIVNASNVIIDQLQVPAVGGSLLQVYTGTTYSGLSSSSNWRTMASCNGGVAVNGTPGQPFNSAQRAWICTLRGTGTPGTSGKTFTTSYASNTSVSYTITAPDAADSILIVARLASNPAATPFDTGTYNVGAYGTGTGRALIGTNNYVVVKSTATTGTISGLTAYQEYSFDAYYFRNEGCIKISSALTSTTSTCAPAVAITGPAAICANATATYTTTYALQANEAYLWSNGATTQSITVSDAGTYSLQIRNTVGNCAGPASNAISLTVNAVPSTPALSLSDNAETCAGTLLSITNTGDCVGCTYTWSDASTGTTLSIGTGTGTYSVTARNAAGCETGSATITVTGLSTGTWLGVNNEWTDASNWCGGVPTSNTNLSIRNIATLPNITTGSAMANDITLAGGATLPIASGGVLTVYGNVTGRGLINGAAGSLVVMAGSGSQTLNGGTFAKLRIKADVSLVGNVAITDSVSLMGANLDVGSSALTLNPTASNVAETAASRIKGLVIARGRTVGTGTLSMLGVSLAAGADDLDTVYVSRVDTAATHRSFSSISHVWRIMAGAQPAAGRSVTLSWPASQNNGRDLSNAQVWRRADAGAAWTKVGETQDASTAINGYHSISVSTTSFSDWTVSDDISPLPVSLLSFTGRVKGNQAHLFWTTASEENTSHFEVEKSADGKNWHTAGQVEAAGNSQKIQRYELTDAVFAAAAYYRLKSVDRDGSFSLSKAIWLESQQLVQLELVPNPTQGAVRFFGTAGGDQAFELAQITDLQGRHIALRASNLTQAQQALSQYLAEAAPGVYHLRLIIDGQALHFRIARN